MITPCGLADRLVSVSVETLRVVCDSDAARCCCDAAGGCSGFRSFSGLDRPTEPGKRVGIIEMSFLPVLVGDTDGDGVICVV